jgi:preprotein translocase subunit SecE
MSESKGWNPVRFGREVQQEAKKVTWTAGRETLITTIMVFIMVALAALFFFAVDSVLRFVVQLGLSFGG